MLSIPSINSSKPDMANATYDRYGNPQLGNSKDVKRIAKLSDDYYFKWNKVGFVNGQKGIGLGAVIALFEMVTAWALIKLERSPATFSNAFTTFGECLQVLISGYEMTRINPNKIEDEKERQLAEQKLKKRENLRRIGMASVVAGAGVGGLWKFVKEYFFKEDSHDLHELPLWQKAALSSASLISSAGMSVGYGEKSLMAALSKDENGGLKSDQIILNARSDGRCSLEWLTMALFPWVVGLKPVKFLIDLGIPLSALHDSVSHLLEPILRNKNVHSHVSCPEENTHPENEKGNWLKRRLLEMLTHKHSVKVPAPYFNSFIFGSSNSQGIRSQLLKPLFRIFGCEPPDCNINEEKKLVVSVPKDQSDNSDLCERDFVTIVPSKTRGKDNPKEKIAALS